MKRKMIVGVAFSLLFGACGLRATEKVVITLEAAQKYLNEGNYQEAVEAYTALIEVDPNNEVLFMERADAYTNLQQYPEAIGDYTSVVSLNENNQDAYVYRGVLNYVNDEPEEGEADLQHVSDMTAGTEENESVYETLVQFMDRLDIETEDEQSRDTTIQIVFKFPLGFRLVITRTIGEPFGVNTISEDEPIPVLYDFVEETDHFLNGFVSEIYHSRDILNDHHTDDYVQGSLALGRLYSVLHEEDSSRYPIDNFLYLNDEGSYTLSADDRSRAQSDPNVSSWISNFSRYDLNAVKDVLDALYGKDKVTPEQFFNNQCFITSDGYLLLPPTATGYTNTGSCRYKIHNIEVEGTEISATVNCILVDADYVFDEEIAWQVPAMGTFYVLDLISEQILARGTDNSLTDYAAYAEYADNYDVEGTGAGETVMNLYWDGDGIHLR